jgi:hypothetical protein
MNERDLRMGEWNNRRQWNMKVGRRRQTFKTALYIYYDIYLFTLVNDFTHKFIQKNYGVRVKL